MFQTTDTYTLPVAMPLEGGGLLAKATLAYSAYGDPAQPRTVVLLHDLDRSHRAGGPPEATAYRPSGWAEPLLRKGGLLDPARMRVIVPALLGSPFGEVRPLPPEAGESAGAEFPALTLVDLARGVAALLRGLKVSKVHALVGVGFGGTLALQIAALFPDLASRVVTLGAAKSLPDSFRQRLGLTRQLLDAEADESARRTLLRKLRLDYLRTVYSRDQLEHLFPDSFAAERFLDAEADAFSRAFSPTAWGILCSAFAGADLGEALGKLHAEVLLVAAAGDAIATPSRVREAYHLLTASGTRAHYYELSSDGGHATLVEDLKRLEGPLSAFLHP